MERTAKENVSGEEPEARYANYFHVGFNAYEVVLEFGQHYEGDEIPRIHNRIVTAPGYASALLRVLQTAVTQYEQKFGQIEPR
jgi:hypothetical protein